MIRLTKPERFSQRVLDEAEATDCTLIETIARICDESDIDPQLVPKLVTAELKDRLEVEARSLNLIKRGT